MATLDELSDRFDPIFKILGSTYGWAPVTFVLEGEYLEVCNIHLTDIKAISRVECWIEEGNQFIYSVDDSVGVYIGEGSDADQEVESIDELLKYVDIDAKIHPLLRKQFELNNLSASCGDDNIASFLFGMFMQVAPGKVEGYHSDLYYDAIFLDKLNKEKNLAERQFEDKEYIFWSVGDCGTHLGIMSDADDRPWTRSHSHYDHYQVIIEDATYGVKINLKRI